MRGLLVAVVAFVVMEPVTYAAHRWVMHGPGRRLHLSHHRPRQGRWEANDLFPVAFGLVVGGAMAVGFNVDGWGWLVPAGCGVTAYGAAYAVVHDGWIHARVPFLARHRAPVADRLADAHQLHHRFGGEPYGMLLPVVPASLRARAAGAQAPSGSLPSHVPSDA